MTTKTTTTSSGTTERGGTNSARALWTGGWRCEVEAGGLRKEQMVALLELA